MSEEKTTFGKKESAYPEISVIIPFHGRKDDLLNCLKGLNNQKTDFSFEIIIVESGNDKDMINSMQFPSNVNLISSKTLLLPGKARNRGASAARSDILAFIDSDCVVGKDWISRAYSNIKSGLEIAIGPILNKNSFLPISTADNHLQFIDFQKYRPSKNINHFPGCNFAITKNLFFGTGGYPKDLEAGEDVLFSQSAIKKCGNKIFFDKKLSVRHKGRNSLDQFFRHNKTFGYYRRKLGLKIPDQPDVVKSNLVYSVIFGCKRLIYICVRTLQWNPAGTFTLILYFPLVILGLFAWTKGFYNGSKA